MIGTRSPKKRINPRTGHPGGDLTESMSPATGLNVDDIDQLSKDSASVSEAVHNTADLKGIFFFVARHRKSRNFGVYVSFCHALFCNHIPHPPCMYFFFLLFFTLTVAVVTPCAWLCIDLWNQIMHISLHRWALWPRFLFIPLSLVFQHIPRLHCSFCRLLRDSVKICALRYGVWNQRGDYVSLYFIRVHIAVILCPISLHNCLRSVESKYSTLMMFKPSFATIRI